MTQPTEMEFDLDKALEDVPVHMDDTPASSHTSSTPSQGLTKHEHRPSGGMVELPSEEDKKLQHFTKLRPRRNKKKQSSKVPVSQAGKQIFKLQQEVSVVLNSLVSKDSMTLYQPLIIA